MRLGAAVNDLGRDPAVVADCLGVLGVEGGVGEPFLSLLPGHEGHEAVVERAPTGAFVYRCRCGDKGAGDATLADVYAATKYGQFELLSRSAAAIWHRLLLKKAGRLEPVPVALPDLPPDADANTKLVRHFFAVTVGLREHDHPGEPTMFSRRFVAAACEISEDRARAAIDAIVSAGVIRRLPDKCRNAYLYVPGDGRPPGGGAVLGRSKRKGAA